MSIEFSLPAHHHHLGESATQPIEPRYGTLSALLLLVSCQAPSVAAHLPSTRMALLQSLPMRRAWAAARA